MEERKMHDEDCKAVYTLNTWTDELKNEARKLLERGYWVRFGSTCIGHTMAEKVEASGMEWAKKEFGESNIQEALREEDGFSYMRLR